MTAPDGWAVGVVVPARDEAERIGPCLRAIRASLRASGRPQAPIVVVADGCRDDTSALAGAALGPADAVVVADLANVGAARRVGTAHLLRLLGVDHGRSAASRTWLLGTDADSTVAPDWVAAHLRLARAGAAGVAGIVRVDSFAEHPPVVASRFEGSYRLHADGSHPHVHGANIGVRADAYLDVGGWPRVATAEDHALWRRLRAAGWPTVSSIDPGVTTSGRRGGRAPNGFAGHLLALGEAPGRPSATAARMGGGPTVDATTVDATADPVAVPAP